MLIPRLCADGLPLADFHVSILVPAAAAATAAVAAAAAATAAAVAATAAARGRSSRGLASLTVRVRPLELRAVQRRRWPRRPRRHLDEREPAAAAGLAVADDLRLGTVPYWENACTRSSLVVSNEMFPTYNFFAMFFLTGALGPKDTRAEPRAAQGDRRRVAAWSSERADRTTRRSAARYRLDCLGGCEV